ncbi:hypothetical protein FRB99_004393, partial [Tulasnella sp. 403]
SPTEAFKERYFQDPIRSAHRRLVNVISEVLRAHGVPMEVSEDPGEYPAASYALVSQLFKI